MADYDPNRDFRDPKSDKSLHEMSPQWEAERNANASWGWILGGLAAVVLVLVAISFARNDTLSKCMRLKSSRLNRPSRPASSICRMRWAR